MCALANPPVNNPRKIIVGTTIILVYRIALPFGLEAISYLKGYGFSYSFAVHHSTDIGVYLIELSGVQYFNVEGTSHPKSGEYDLSIAARLP